MDSKAVIKVIGVGGGGCNSIGHMVKEEINGADFYCINTDIQSLINIDCDDNNKIQIGIEQTKGLGAGANPEIGEISAEESREQIEKMVAGADMVFIAAGMGGGTGTGAAPVVAEISKSMGILTVAVVTKPFNFEGNRRMNYANEGIEKLKKHVDSIIIIPNQKLMEKLDRSVSLMNAFTAVNEVLHIAVKGVSDLITEDGMINIDFADIRTVMSSRGLAMMGLGKGKGEDRALDAVKEAISSPLLDDVDISDAEGIIVSIVSGLDITLEELGFIGDEIAKITSHDSVRVVGNTFNLDMQDEINISVIATGLKNKEEGRIDKSNSPFSLRQKDKNTNNSTTKKHSDNNIPHFLKKSSKK